MRIEQIKIKDIDYCLKLGFGVMMQFEEETGKNITQLNLKGSKDLSKLCFITLQYNNENFPFSYKRFIDEVIDDDPKIWLELVTKISSLMFGDEKDVSSDKKK